MKINDIVNRIKLFKKIAITFHTSPDGDSIGSALALLIGLRKLNKDVHIVSKEVIPQTFQFLPYSNEINGETIEPSVDTECVIVLDCGDFKRINSNLCMQNRKFELINMDHHLSNDLYGDLNFVDTSASAASEIVFEVLRLLNVELDKEIAACLYTSLLTDTGSFRHSSTTAVTHAIAGELISTGIDFSNIHRLIFENKKFEKIKFYGEVIGNMTSELNSKVCIMYISKNMLEKYSFASSDTSDVITFGASIDTVEVTILIKEAENGVRVSLRSKSLVDVSKIAETFNGGGHIRAAGFFTETNFDDTKVKLLEILEKELIK
ncbi:bifunctional oligoribonuclease/PAP phosphatase NrnA [Clostridium bowmanii]|uniref:DHH family phosphoesterase n=1 Tax=Clostridium bowmanii TaxID=132925 RepID=UPI001C0CB7C3|nr:bifunctional oligoribonuclease/PAP phosphatase NrnA [Clostridium bowmanii]MBU3189260.1 bifunctional oligoribonuclease/PAP phosphatase NrnA [Clostridium bowmanii]MCA1073144.1 bifunctional oligoribonuclease/PAP phosphatase NrnA [Clostridium bowmanii]